MEKSDARTLSPDVQLQLRKQVVRMKQQGKSFVDIADSLGIHRNSAMRFWKNYLAEGAAGLVAEKRGIKHGTHRTIPAEQEADVRRCIKDKSPDQFKMTFALWTRQAVRDLIRLRTGVDMPIRTVGEYLKRWGYTPQKPLKRAYEQRPAEVQKWLTETYPAISERAAAEDAEIHWGDETGIRSDSQHGRSYAPKGETPVIHLSAKRTSVNMISSITNQGKVRFMLYDGTLNAKVLIRFLERLCRDAGRKVFLILDNLRVHHAKVVQEWLAGHHDAIEIFYLPSYSPELNPDEYLNGDLKAGVHSTPPHSFVEGAQTCRDQAHAQTPETTRTREELLPPSVYPICCMNATPIIAGLIVPLWTCSPCMPGIERFFFHMRTSKGSSHVTSNPRVELTGIGRSE